MRSSYADSFNHDDIAAEYDRDVLNENHPIRAGYDATLDWVARSAGITSQSRVLELGSGTGNLSRRIPDCKTLICVDVSQKMEDLARKKVNCIKDRRFIKDDILDVFEQDVGTFDAILSTYTIHHLTEEEKEHLFRKVRQALTDGGKAVFGDLMFETRAAKRTKIGEYLAKGDHGTAEAIEEEFFWFVDETKNVLKEIGFAVTVKRFSDLSFGILARKQ